MRRATITLAVTSLLAGLTVSGAGAAPGDPPAAPVADEHRRIVEHWTAERRAQAVPRDVLLPAAKPDNPGGGNGKGGGGGGGDGGGDSGTVTGETWSGGGAVTEIVGKVFFGLGAGTYTCSGSAVSSAAGNLVLTAGHCVHDGAGGDFATNWIFYPGWDGAPDPALGEWTATDLFTTDGWAGSGDFDDDAGFARVTDGAGGSLAAILGDTLPSMTFGTSTGDAVSFGFPAAKKYKGNTLTYCAGPVTAGLDGNATMALGCDMTGGSSGGPWYTGPLANNGADTVMSLNSYGYSSLNGVMFGPVFDSAEQAAYGAASSGACTVGAGYVCA